MHTSLHLFSHLSSLGVLFGLNTGSSQDIQISSLNEFISCPLSNHPCNKFSSAGLTVKSEPWVLWNHILLFLSCSDFLFAVYCFHKLCLCCPALGFSTLQMACSLQRKWRNSLLWQSGHDLMTFYCPWSERWHSPSLTYVRYLVV